MWNVERVILVAGASCVGKTTFLKALAGPRPPRLPEGLRSLNAPEFEQRNAMDLLTPGRGARPPRRIVLHYDIFRPITFFGSEDFDADPVLRLLRFVPDVAVLTLWDDPALLHARSVARRRHLWKKLARRSSFRSPLANLHRFAGARARRDRMRPWLADGDRLWDLYDGWFDFVRDAGVEKHWIARPSRGMACVPLGNGRPDAPLWPVGRDGMSAPRGEDGLAVAGDGVVR